MKNNLTAKIFKSIYVFVLLFCTSHSLFAQYEGLIPKVTTQTPNSVALFKAEAKPVGSYTGTSAINLPLFKVSSQSLVDNVSISYTNGGIKVEEISSWVGLGWNLNCGGRISRTVNGEPDDNPSKGLLYTTLKPSAFPGSNSIQNSSLVVSGQLDVEPDIFYFNFSGRSGKFYFDENGNLRIIDKTELKIDFYTNNGIKGWVITDEKGTQYYFGLDKSHVNSATDISNISYDGTGSVPSPAEAYISSWHLLEIRDMNEQNIIKYEYEQNFTNFTTRNGSFMAISGVTGLDCSSTETVGQEMFVLNNTSEYHLKKIITNNQVLIFQSSLSREDLSGGVKLNEIWLCTKTNQTQPIKKFQFNYGYFTSPNAPSGTLNDTYYKRLKLNSVSEFGTNNTTSNSHTFNYHEDVNLPSRLSYSVDYWGYYNGANNFDLLANGEYNTGSGSYSVFNNADRRSYPYYAKANTLKEIIYPTGGKREYVYEGNQILLDYFYNQIKPDNGSTINQSFSETNFNFLSEFMPSASKAFTINSSASTTNFNWSVNQTSCYNNNLRVKLVKLSAYLPETDIYEWNGDFSGTFAISNGDYRIDVYEAFDCTLNTLNGSWTETLPPPASIARFNGLYFAQNNNAGGIRVKEIKDFDVNGTLIGQLKYEYKLPSNNALTSGMLVSPVVVATRGGCPAPNRNCEYIKLNSNSAYPLASYGGSYVVYPEVRTIEEGNGYTDRVYSFAYDIEPGAINYYNEFPIVPAKDNSWKRGILTWERFYSNSGQKISEKYTEGYESDLYVSNDLMINSQQGNKVVGYYQSNGCPAPGADNGVVCSTCWKPYFIFSQFNATRKIKNITYNSNNQPIEQITEYDYYTNLGKTLIKEERVFLNNGKVKTTTYKYAFNDIADFEFGLTSNEQSIKATLFNKHYYGPLEITTKVGEIGQPGVLTAGVKLFHETFGTALHLQNIKEYTSLSDYKETIINNYDINGNLLEKQDAFGIKTSYQWGYDNTYPIAECVNASTSEFFNENFEANGTLGDSHTGDKFNSGAYTVNWTKPNSRLYVLSYWYKTGGEWFYSGEIAYNTNSYGLSGADGYDDIRIQPKDAQMTTYTYDPLIGMSSTTDAAGRTTYYQYDSFQRLQYVKDQNRKILNAYCYNYAGQSIDCFTSVATQPTTIYARVEISNHSYYSNYYYPNYSDHHDAEVSIHLYSDAACTIPYIVSSPFLVTIENYYEYSSSYYGAGNSSYPSNHTITAGNSSISLGTQAISYTYYTDDPFYGFSYDSTTFQFYTISNGTNNYINVVTLN